MSFVGAALRFYVLAGVSVMSIVGCAPPISGSQASHVPEDVACMAQVEMSPEESASFVSANLPAVIRGRRSSQELYVIRDEDSLRLIGLVPICTTGAFVEDFGLLRLPDGMRAAPISIPEAQQTMMLAHSPRSSNEVRGCIVTYPFQNEMQIAPLIRDLPYTGVRAVQFEGADNVAFVAANDDCEFVSSVMVALDMQRELEAGRICPASSLSACGYPHEIEVGE